MQPVTRELSTGEIITQGFSLFREQFPRIVVPLFFGALIAALVRVLFAIQTAALTQQLTSFRNITVNETNAGRILSLAVQSLSYTVLEALVLFIISVPFFAMAFKVAYDSSSGKTPSLKDGFFVGFNLLPSLLIAGFIVGILVSIGLVLLVVPGIIFVIMFLMFIPAIALENESSLGSLGRSRHLVSRRWGSVFLVGLVAFIISIVLNTLFGNIFGFLNIYASSVVQPFYGLISDALGISFLTRLYESLLIKEGGASLGSQAPPLTMTQILPVRSH